MHRIQNICGHIQPSTQIEQSSVLHEQKTSSTSTSNTTKLDPNAVYIVSAVRTPIGHFQSSLASLSATKLGSIAAQAAILRAGIQANAIDEVYMGNVMSANLGQAPARQAALGAGIPESSDCTTVNKVCSSGLKAVMLGAQSIQLKQASTVLAGGFESMSQVPYYLDKQRSGSKMGHVQAIDGLIKDGLWDVYNDFHMGSAAELCAARMNFTRQQQDEYAINSFKRAAHAYQQGFLQKEIVPIAVPSGVGKPNKTVDRDEGYTKVDFNKLSQLRASFKVPKSALQAKPDYKATVTAGNASSISDGAAALVLMSGARCMELGAKPLARIVNYADAARKPEEFTIAPALAVERALKNAGLNVSDIDYFEFNEAFSAVALANMQLLKLNPERVNVWGGAIALGHPLGCSGARILVTLIHVLTHHQAKRGIAAICNGGGGASAVIIERV